LRKNETFSATPRLNGNRHAVQFLKIQIAESRAVA
jgi:hypothetical protein